MKVYYTTGEVAEMLGVSVTTVWKWCQEGKIQAIKTLGGQYRIPHEELERILKGSKDENEKQK